MDQGSSREKTGQTKPAMVGSRNPVFSARPNLSPDPLVQLGLAETDAHASAVTTDGSGVKLGI